MFDRAIRQIPVIVLLVVALYAVFISQNERMVYQWGMWPGETEGLWQMIVGYNFLHGDMGHLISNVTGIVPLLFLLALVHSNPWVVSGVLVVLTGLLLWFIADPSQGSVHIGASGFFFALVGFLIVYGFRKGTWIALMTSGVVLYWHGMNAVLNSLPILAMYGISWEGHLSGLIAGAAYALIDRSDRDGSSG